MADLVPIASVFGSIADLDFVKFFSGLQGIRFVHCRCCNILDRAAPIDLTSNACSTSPGAFPGSVYIVKPISAYTAYAAHCMEDMNCIHCIHCVHGLNCIHCRRRTYFGNTQKYRTLRRTRLGILRHTLQHIVNAWKYMGNT